jgi:benzodiazapine receptor
VEPSNRKAPWLRSAAGLAAFLLLAFAAAGLGGIATGRSVRDWYPTLAKPAWTPPAWVFGPVWTVLYALMGAAAWRVWRRHGVAGALRPLALFAVQLILNAAWSWIFFGFRMPGAAFAEIVVLWAAIAATTASFWRADRPAGILFIPYLLWVTFAAALNFALWRLNA